MQDLSFVEIILVLFWFGFRFIVALAARIIVQNKNNLYFCSNINRFGKRRVKKKKNNVKVLNWIQIFGFQAFLIDVGIRNFRFFFNQLFLFHFSFFYFLFFIYFHSLLALYQWISEYQL